MIEPTSPLTLRLCEAAKVLGISLRLLWQLTKDGRIPCVRVGGGKRKTVQYPLADLQASLSRESNMANGGEPCCPLELLLSNLPGAKKSGSGWSARRPAHDDSHSSLSVSAGDDGRVLLRCHAGFDNVSASPTFIHHYRIGVCG